jgi:hypothetical protein
VEPHPVPQDILNTEFKLFGAFTLRQFSYILLGCLIAIGIFLIPIPVIIKLPMMIASIGNGIAMAIIPRWGAKTEGFLKAIFLSPRYVWVRESETPDMLQRKAQLKTTGGKQVKKNQNGRKIDLEEISLEEMLSARQTGPRSTTANIPIPKDKFDFTPREQNLDRTFKEIYANVQPKPQQNQQTQFYNVGEKNLQTQQANQSSQQVQNISAQNPLSQITTKDQLVNEINELKRSLGFIVKDQSYKEKEAEVLARINDLYHELKMKGFEDSITPKVQVDQSKLQTFQGGNASNLGQIVFGIVVDKSDKPIADAEIYFDLKNSDKDIAVYTDAKGQFNSVSKILPGEYDISIKHPNYKFHTYKINVTENNLPAYKLRAK